MNAMQVKLCGVELKNPVITASGTFGYGMEYQEFYPISRLGGISCREPPSWSGREIPPRGSPRPPVVCSIAWGCRIPG